MNIKLRLEEKLYVIRSAFGTVNAMPTRTLRAFSAPASKFSLPTDGFRQHRNVS
jgi:hypothetical protein